MPSIHVCPHDVILLADQLDTVMAAFLPMLATIVFHPINPRPANSRGDCDIVFQRTLPLPSN
jgi:hypothetical protein